MANTYTQIHIQFVFAVKFRDAVITQDWEEKLHKYMTGIVQKYNHKLLAINGMPDHVHILVGMRPTQSASDLMEEVKGGSSKWINEQKFLKTKFAWQDGFGAFSYTKSHVPTGSWEANYLVKVEFINVWFHWNRWFRLIAP